MQASKQGRIDEILLNFRVLLILNFFGKKKLCSVIGFLKYW
jgi:hypothetical protein